MRKLFLLFFCILWLSLTNKAVAQCTFDISASIMESLYPCEMISGSIFIFNVSGGVSPYTYQWSNGSTNSTIQGQSQSYVVTVTDANNCSFIQSFYIPSVPVPLFSGPDISDLVITNATCGQANGSITGIFAQYSFNWYDQTNNVFLPIGSPNAGPANVLNVPAGQYTISSYCFSDETFTIGNDGLPSVETINQSTCDTAQVGTTTNTYTSVAGCDSTVTVITTLIAVDAEITQNGNTLTANDATADAYQWLDCNNGNTPIVGATAATFMPTVSGNYALAITREGCTDNSDCVNIIVTAINPVVNNKIIVRLNNRTAINIDGIQPNTMANIYGIDGRLLLKQKLSTVNEQLDIEHLTNGTYVLRLLNEQAIIFNQKFVKQ